MDDPVKSCEYFLARTVKLQKSHPDAAVMYCRKAMEVILHDIFNEKYGNYPEGYIPNAILMSSKKGVGIKEEIPQYIRLDIETIQRWGNFATHYSREGIVLPHHVESALVALEHIMKWFSKPKMMEKIKKQTQDAPLEVLLARSVELCSDQFGWAYSSEVGATVRKLSPEFRVKEHGYNRFLMLLRSFDELFEFDESIDSATTRVRKKSAQN